ncbi:hypothetical protein [Acinetobacter baumannii]|uniref:hypothetical protein n=1 Tax=Acinetobacter baumannii TaxID=470 RepID=UPI001BFDEF51|nr:hypothetical protein [Acinetobacter baumannii]MBT8175034.1 hypothetical protein [Acinetobacter baumannii]
MTIVIQSDIVATNYLSDEAGIKDSDYLMSADFVNQKYKLNNAYVQMSDIIAFTRATAAYQVAKGTVQTIPENVPVFGDPVTGESGLWSATTMGNVVGSGICNTSKTVTHTAPARIGSIFNLQMWGTGSVTVSGDVELVNSTLTATEGHSIQYKTKANASDPTKSIVNFTVAGSIVHYQSANDASYAYNHPTLTTVNKPTVLVKQSIIDQLKALPSFVMLVRAKLEVIANPTVALGIGEITTDYNHVYAIVNPSKKFSIGASDGNTGAWNSSDPDAVGDLTYIIRYTQGEMKVFREGQIVLTKTGNATSILSAIQFFATNKYTSGRNQFNGLLKNVAIYTKTMTDDELKKLSQSFKW